MDPNKQFKNNSQPRHEDTQDITNGGYLTPDPPWEPFWDCISFASEDCDGKCEEDCDHCDAPRDSIELLCATKW